MSVGPVAGAGGTVAWQSAVKPAQTGAARNRAVRTRDGRPTRLRQGTAGHGAPGVKPHQAKTFKLSTDPFFIEKVRDIRRVVPQPAGPRDGPVRG